MTTSSWECKRALLMCCFPFPLIFRSVSFPSARETQHAMGRSEHPMLKYFSVENDSTDILWKKSMKDKTEMQRGAKT